MTTGSSGAWNYRWWLTRMAMLAWIHFKHIVSYWSLVNFKMNINRELHLVSKCVWRNIYNTARATHTRYYKYFAKHAWTFSLTLLEHLTFLCKSTVTSLPGHAAVINLLNHNSLNQLHQVLRRGIKWTLTRIIHLSRKTKNTKIMEEICYFASYIEISLRCFRTLIIVAANKRCLKMFLLVFEELCFWEGSEGASQSHFPPEILAKSQLDFY
jgi:hypothetical protein